MSVRLSLARRGLAPLLAALLLAPACGGPEGYGAAPGDDAAEVAADVAARYAIAKVDANLAEADPLAPFWADVPTRRIDLLAQPIITPRPEVATTDSVELAAVHDGERVALRLRWKDPEKSEAGRLGEFSDAVAVQFPMHGFQETSVFMGTAEHPVHILHWRAQYQRDAEVGKPEMKDLYPNLSVDMYPLEFADAPGGTAEQREVFSPGTVTGNPQSYRKSGVDEIVAEGFMTSAVQEGHDAHARGVWEDGYWTVAFTRNLEIAGGSSLLDPARSALSVAVWQGGHGEVGSRKCLAMQWHELEVVR
jgi:hypothetical protein